ncbi:hypothetical protein D3C80_676920 [compost metagenome]
MNTGRQDAKEPRVIGRHGDDRVVRRHIRIKEAKPAMLGRLHRHDVARQTLQRRTKLPTRLAEDPPVFTIGRAVVQVALRLHRFKQVLENGRMPSARLRLRPIEQVDHASLARTLSQITPVAILSDGRLGCFVGSLQQRRRARRGHDESRAVKLDARRAQQGVGLQRLGPANRQSHGQVRSNRAALFVKDDLGRLALTRALVNDRQKTTAPIGLAPLGHRHGDADIGATDALDPWMIRDGEAKAHRRRAAEMVLQHASREGLGDRVGGDEAEPPQPTALGRQDLGRAIPPGGDQVG